MRASLEQPATQCTFLAVFHGTQQQKTQRAAGRDTSNGPAWTVRLNNNTPTVDPVFPVLLKRNHRYHQKAGAQHAAHTLIPIERVCPPSSTNPSQPRGRPRHSQLYCPTVSISNKGTAQLQTRMLHNAQHCCHKATPAPPRMPHRHTRFGQQKRHTTACR
jgi:hypothetical protein